MTSLMIMGGVTVAIGFLPTYATIAVDGLFLLPGVVLTPTRFEAFG